MNANNSLKLRIFTLGNGQVGKTCFILRFTEDSFQPAHLMTTGIDLKTKLVELNNKKYNVSFYDTAGQERFRSICYNSIKSADGIILMFDLTNQKSYDEISNWMMNIKDIKGDDFPMILIGNKCDLEKERVISKEEGIELSKKYKLKYFEASNKTGENIQESGTSIISLVIEARDRKMKEAAKDFEVIEKFELEKTKTFKKKKHKMCKK